jgi:tRNA pseudouridine55 synthase
MNGLVVVDKPPGCTSHDVVARCRRIFGLRRVGHAGTLDPDATGVLLVGLGRSTRLLRFLSGLDKDYTAEIVLGTATDTLDASGAVTGRWDMSATTLAAAQAAARQLTGAIDQRPPMVSAVKVKGRRLHSLARQGIEVDRPTRRVRVQRFELDAGGEPGVLTAAVTCSSGTYVRALAADLGSALGGGAHVRRLRRRRVGPFDEATARPLDTLEAADVLSPARALPHLASVSVPAAVAEMVRRGRPLGLAEVPAGPGPWAVLDQSGALLAVYERGGGERWRAAVVMAAQ